MSFNFGQVLKSFASPPAGGGSKLLKGLSAASLALETVGGLAQSFSAKSQAEDEARQLQWRASMERAMGQRRADRIATETKSLIGTQIARAAAGMGGAGGKTALLLNEETFKKGSLEQLLELAQAEDRASQDEASAAAARYQGGQDMGLGLIRTGATLLKGYSDWQDRYGAPGRRAAPIATPASPWVDRASLAPVAPVRTPAKVY